MCVSITDLVPESINLLKENFYIIPTILISLIFIVVRIILSMGIDKYLSENKNYQDNLYYYFGSLFSFYKCYFNSSSIICFILSMSVKNKFNPLFLLTIIYLKLSKISFFI